MKVTNLAFYQFVQLDDPDALAAALGAECARLGLRGTVTVGPEGINAMLAGPGDAADAFVQWLRDDERFESTPLKLSASDHIPFRRLKVKVKPEIVSMRVDGVRTWERTAPHLAPEALRDLLRGGRDDLALIDTRNDFEVDLGTFRGALNPHTTSFSEFPSWVEEHRDELAGKQVVMFCTGGIRCEKATSWMLDAGFEDVLQLDGGVLNYFAQVDDAERDWEGRLFVFDERETLDTTGRGGSPREDAPPPCDE